MAMFATQLQPWEENQSPSPTDERENPYELALARSRSSSKSGHAKNDSKPPSPVNTLHRQLSGDPEAPPPAWKRRSSVTSRSPSSGSNHSGPPSASRRHPGLQMSLSNHGQPLPDAGPLHETPDMADLGLPQPAFRRRSNASSGRSSNRSSSHSLSGMGLTSEELWQLDHPDASNPDRPSRERPLDTARRMSQNYDRPQPWQGGLPGEVIWPAALDAGDAAPPIKSKSTLSLASIGQKKKITIRKRPSRNQSLVDTSPNDGVYLHGTTVSPNSLSRPESMILSSSAQSSTTSLNSQGFSPIKVTANVGGNRPPSTYYSRDFLSSLAPREGGYAIAATMGNGLGARGAMSVDERRKSQYDPSIRRAPVSKSAGMGRWSLDGGEHYGARPYGTPSAATTASNLSAPPITSPETSPPLEEIRLPEGASPPPSALNTALRSIEQNDASSPAATPTITIPVNPSPLSQQTHANDMATPRSERAPPVPAPVPVSVSAPTDTPTSTLSAKKSKKDLAKDAKADAQRQKIEDHKRKAEAKAVAVKAKSDKKEAEAKAKLEARRKEKEAREKYKAEKQAKKTGTGSSFASLPAAAMLRRDSTAPPVPALPTASKQASPGEPGPVPFPRTNETTSPLPKPNQPTRQTATSMPLEKSITSPAQRTAQTSTPTPTLKERKSRLGFFGTLKKRFSSGPSSGQPDLRTRQASDAANLSSMPSKPTVAAATPIAAAHTPSAVPSTSSMPVMAATPPRSQSLAPSPPPGGADPIPMLSQPPANPISPERAAPPSAFNQTPGSPTPIAKAVSRDMSVKSGRSNSVRGPRPMPVQSSPDRDHRSRPTSLITTPSTEAAPVTPAAGFPFKSGLGLGPEIVTPSTATETETEGEPSIDSSVFSHAAQSSPFTSVGSRASSLTADEKTPVTADLTSQLPANERGVSTTSKSSDETVQAASLTQTVATA